MTGPFIIAPETLREIATSRRKMHVDARAALLLAAFAIEYLSRRDDSG